MSSKLEYLKRYKKGGSGNKKKKAVKETQKSNYFVIDDDASWMSTLSDAEPVVKCDDDDDPDDAPLIAELRDESVVKWQPLSMSEGNVASDNPTGVGENEAAQKNRTRGDVSPTDLSPPRRVKHIVSDSRDDLSPPRKKVHDRAKKLKHPEQDLNTSGSELSPPRRTQRTDTVDRRTDCTADRKNTDPVDRSGRFAETVYRNRVSDHSATKVDENAEKNDEEFMLWGRGVAQTRAAMNKVEDEEYEMSKPLARFADDEDLEKMQKARLKEGDPMLLFMKKKKGKTSTVTPLKKKGKPQYKGNMAPNRFGIYPGYRWDGVNRSNGFEKAWLAKASNSKAIQEKSYKWSVEDM